MAVPPSIGTFKTEFPASLSDRKTTHCPSGEQIGFSPIGPVVISLRLPPPASILQMLWPFGERTPVKTIYRPSPHAEGWIAGKGSDKIVVLPLPSLLRTLR